MTQLPLRYPDSDFTLLTDSSNNRIYVRLAGLTGAQQATATTTRIFYGNQTFIIPAAIDDVMDSVDPIPGGPPPPPVDITQGMLRINPQGTAIAHQLVPSSLGADWQILVLATNRFSYTTNVNNPEILSWPFLKV